MTKLITKQEFAATIKHYEDQNILNQAQVNKTLGAIEILKSLMQNAPEAQVQNVPATTSVTLDGEPTISSIVLTPKTNTPKSSKKTTKKKN